MPRRNLEDEVRSLYARAHTELGMALEEGRFGFKPLNSPPRWRPLLMIIGYQPFGRQPEWESERGCGTHLQWPKRGDFEHRKGPGWLLADKMREVFKWNGHDCLKNYVGTNAIWVRDGSMSEYAKNYSVAERRHIRTHSIEGVRTLVRLMEPQRIVVVGIGTFKLFGRSTAPHPEDSGGPALTRTGAIEGRPAIACWHLTGTRITHGQREKITTRLRDWVSSADQMSPNDRQAKQLDVSCKG